MIRRLKVLKTHHVHHVLHEKDGQLERRRLDERVHHGDTLLKFGIGIDVRRHAIRRRSEEAVERREDAYTITGTVMQFKKSAAVERWEDAYNITGTVM